MDALPDLGPLPGPPLPPAAPLLLGSGTGAHAVEAPTVDSDADGTPDTAVLAGAGPGGEALVLATDLDGDHHADVVTTVDAAGRAVTALAGPDGRFDVDLDVDLDLHPDADAGPPPLHDAAWGGRGEGPPPPAPTIDPLTGTWTRGAGVP